MGTIQDCEEQLKELKKMGLGTKNSINNYEWALNELKQLKETFDTNYNIMSITQKQLTRANISKKTTILLSRLKNVIRNNDKRILNGSKVCCQICGIKKDLYFHHSHYKRGREINILCKKCHLEAHKKQY